eukprot:6189319-Pleurochrysis_carterae.AAC.4
MHALSKGHARAEGTHAKGARTRKGRRGHARARGKPRELKYCGYVSQGRRPCTSLAPFST